MACFEYEEYVRGELKIDRSPQLSDAMIGGMGINLFNNRLGIAAGLQWQLPSVATGPIGPAGFCLKPRAHRPTRSAASAVQEP